jgi:hypothetical protein
MAILDTLHLPFQLPANAPATAAAGTPARLTLRLPHWAPPHDALTLALFAVVSALLLLTVLLRRVLAARRTFGSGPGLTTPVALSFASAGAAGATPAQPAHGAGPKIELAARLGGLAPPRPKFALPNALRVNLVARLVELFDLLEDDDDNHNDNEVTRVSEKHAGFGQFALAPPPPGSGAQTRHRRTQSVSGPAALQRQLAQGPPPQQAQMSEMPQPRPLSAAKMIMTRHVRPPISAVHRF